MNNKQHQLDALAVRMITDTSLPLETNFVFGEGNAMAEVVFIGEAPGATEDQMKRPFVGRAGQVLRKMIREIGWREEDVYITNIVKRRPPENRDPSPEEIAAYSPYLAEQIQIISPVVIVPLGRFSMNFFLPDAKIMRDQGKVYRVQGRFVVPFLHPAAALRATQVMDMFTSTFRKLPTMVQACKNYKPDAKGIEEIQLIDAGDFFSADEKSGGNQQSLF